MGKPWAAAEVTNLRYLYPLLNTIPQVQYLLLNILYLLSLDSFVSSVSLDS